MRCGSDEKNQHRCGRAHHRQRRSPRVPVAPSRRELWVGRSLRATSVLIGNRAYSHRMLHRPRRLVVSVVPWCVAVAPLAVEVRPVGAKTPEYRPTNPWVTECLDGVGWRYPQVAFADCDRTAAEQKRFGDVVVAFSPERQSVEVVATKTLGPRYERCVMDVLRRSPCLLNPPKTAAHFDWPRLYDLPFGNPRPDLPEIRQLLEPWQAYENASWFWPRRKARRALQALLPPDTTITPAGCLRRPSTANVSRATMSWLGGAGKPVAPLWRGPLDTVIGDGVHHDTWTWIGSRSAVSAVTKELPASLVPADLRAVIESGDSDGGTTLCLRAIDATEEEEVHGRMRSVGSGWVGSFFDILTAPKVALPKDRRYRDVAVPDGGMCAVDDNRGLVCAGSRVVAPDLRGSFEQIASSGNRLCARTTDGLVMCQSEGRRPETGPAGPFADVSTTVDGTCAVRSGGELVCWSLGGQLEPSPPGLFDSLARHGGHCGARRDRHAVCWTSDGERVPRVRDISADVRSVDGNPDAGCIVRESGEAWCWTGDAPPRQVGGSLRFHQNLGPGAHGLVRRHDERRRGVR